MSQRRAHQWVDVQTTVNAATATFTDPSAYQIPSGSSAQVDAKIVGRNTTSGACLSWKVNGLFKNVAGVRSLEGSLSTPVGQGDAGMIAASGAAISVSGSNIVCTADGVEATTIEWTAHVSLLVE